MSKIKAVYSLFTKPSAHMKPTYFSGVIGHCKEGKLSSDFKAQTHQMFSNISERMEQA